MTEMDRSPSPLRYPGGKTSLFPLLASYISALGIQGCRYLEPFAGGGGCALKLLFSDLVSEIVLNDKDPAVYAFWRAVLDHNDDFIELISETPLTVEEWRHQRANYLNAGRGDHLTLGFAFFYLNRTNRSGILKAGPIGGYAQTGNYLIDARFNRDALSDRVSRIGVYRDQITVNRLDAATFLRRRFEQPVEQHSLFYIDPPYYIKGQRLYEKFYRHDDHEELAELLGAQRDQLWIMSYDDVPEISAIYRFFPQARLDFNYSVAGARTAQEKLIWSDAVGLNPSEIDLATV